MGPPDFVDVGELVIPEHRAVDAEGEVAADLVLEARDRLGLDQGHHVVGVEHPVLGDRREDCPPRLFRAQFAGHFRGSPVVREEVHATLVSDLPLGDRDVDDTLKNGMKERLGENEKKIIGRMC